METLQPKLRFLGFKGDWKKVQLKELSEKPKYGLNTSAKEYDGVNGYIRITDIDDSSRIFLKDSITSPNEFSEDYLVKENDILFTRTGASTGKSYIYDSNDGKLYFAGFLINFSITKANSKFVFYNTLIENYSKWVKVMSMRSGQPGINAEEYSSYKLSVPSLKEQTKIANFLSSIDEKLNLLKEKKALLEDYKKGMMQKIFNQELRFKDDNGDDFEEWEEKSLGEIGHTFNGLTGKTKENFGIGGKPYIQYKQIFDNSKINIDKCEFVEITEKDNQNSVQYGDVFFTVSSETPNEIGTASVLLDNVKEMYLNSFCFGYRANSLNILVPEFSRYLFRSELFRSDIVKLAQGSTRYNMSKVELLKLKILLPNKKEQTKIANFLSAIDKKIELVSTQIEETQEYKKGLLQQMFV